MTVYGPSWETITKASPERAQNRKSDITAGQFSPQEYRPQRIRHERYGWGVITPFFASRNDYSGGHSEYSQLMLDGGLNVNTAAA